MEEDLQQHGLLLIGAFVKRSYKISPPPRLRLTSRNAPSPSYRNGTRVIVSPLIALPFCRLFANCSNNSGALAIHAQPPPSFRPSYLSVLVVLVSLN